MGIAQHLREIGRGKDGTRSLGREEARDLMTQVLDGNVTDLELGAFAIAMRIKGESVAELQGFMDAAHDRCIVVPTDAATVVLPSYNGARKRPNLTTLLALLLAQEDIQVLVHGPEHDPGRVTTAEIFHDLGLPLARTASDIANGWARREPVFVPTEALSPPLARLLAVRRTLGLRNSGHTMAKLLLPVRGRVAMRVVNHTHPDYASALAGFLQLSGADALLMRGTEGEPVADARRMPKLDVYLGGEARPDLSSDSEDSLPAVLPLLPKRIDATCTAVYIQSVVSSEQPAPPPLLRQVECLARALAALEGAGPLATERA